MPITVAQLNRLQNFKKYTCSNCSADFYAFRPSKHCSSGCKQASYRARQLNEVHDNRIKVIGFNNPIKEANQNTRESFSDDLAKRLLKEAENRLKQILKK